MPEVEGLQYRVKEAWRVVTKMAVKETRLAEIRQEIFNSKKLKVSMSLGMNIFIKINYNFQSATKLY